MKRYWLFTALLFLGASNYSHATALIGSNSSAQYTLEMAMSPNDPTITEMLVLERAAPMIGVAYQELLNMYQTGTASMNQDADGTWVVTAYLSGGTVIAVINDFI